MAFQVFVRTGMDEEQFASRLSDLVHIPLAEGRLASGAWRSMQWSGMGIDLDVFKHPYRDVPEVLCFTQYPIQIRLGLYRLTDPPDIGQRMCESVAVYLAKIVSESVSVGTAVTDDIEKLVCTFEPTASK